MIDSFQCKVSLLSH